MDLVPEFVIIAALEFVEFVERRLDATVLFQLILDAPPHVAVALRTSICLRVAQHEIGERHM